jgi:transaldolase/glucose-6-phosphate isomerase
MTKLHDLQALGQSVWYDNIERALLDSGELAALVATGVTGVTSNPSIFEKAIAGSAEYDAAIAAMPGQASLNDIYEALVLDDIGRAADVLRSVYEETDGRDGYVSLEVSPELAHDTIGTVAEARRLFAILARPNVMIKVPATPAGIPAVRTLIGAGVNINVTLIFSLDVYEAVARAYLDGLADFFAENGEKPPASVASFFVSRVDTTIDRLLAATGEDTLQGRAGIANAKAAYARFRRLFDGAAWEALAARGARVQRPLWASTSTKNPAYPDTLYLDHLIGPQTVNTVPPATLAAFRNHGTVAETLADGLEAAEAHLAALAAAGIDMEAVTAQLLDEGVHSFTRSFQGLMASLAEKRAALAARPTLLTTLGRFETTAAGVLADTQAAHMIPRIWEHDHTVWRPDPTGIANRLGWLHTPQTMIDELASIETLVQAVRADGFTDVLLLGMGGSSLAPEVFRRVFGVQDGHLDLAVCDSTDPEAVRAHEARLDLSKTLIVVSTKSGGTVETLSFFKYFYNRVLATVGTATVGRHFVAITDPGSRLVDLARRYDFRATFLNDPNIGGRYSALSFFGLVPAALVGVDLRRLLERAQVEAADDPASPANRAACLGVVMGALAGVGRDKLTLVASPALESFGDWVEQLIAESTGKEGKGILPVVGEPLGPPAVYGDDRLFVYLHLAGDATHDEAVAALEAAGQPVVRLRLDDRYDLGAQMFLWELATAVAGALLDIQPFDQPNVEAAKVLARKMVAAYAEQGQLPASETTPLSAAALQEFLSQAQPGDYIALQAYVPPTPETTSLLGQLQARLRDQTGLATTLGFGPRFLHSTGQLHKGDAGNGLFVQFTSDAEEDLPIPDEAGADASAMPFGILKNAQALGDYHALQEAGRRVIHFHLGTAVVADMRRLLDDLS